MKKLVLCMLAALLLGPATFSEDGTRLHVIGRTDLACDQEFKLTVRDWALLYIAQYPECTSYDSLAAGLEEFLNGMCILHGRPADISIETGVFGYSACEYGGMKYPAGDYPAVRIRIGPGEGRNWWGMLNAALLPGAEEDVIYRSAIIDWILGLFGAAAAADPEVLI